MVLLGVMFRITINGDRRDNMKIDRMEAKLSKYFDEWTKELQECRNGRLNVCSLRMMRGRLSLLVERFRRNCFDFYVCLVFESAMPRFDTEFSLLIGTICSGICIYALFPASGIFKSEFSMVKLSQNRFRLRTIFVRVDLIFSVTYRMSSSFLKMNDGSRTAPNHDMKDPLDLTARSKSSTRQIPKNISRTVVETDYRN